MYIFSPTNQIVDSFKGERKKKKLEIQFFVYIEEFYQIFPQKSPVQISNVTFGRGWILH